MERGRQATLQNSDRERECESESVCADFYSISPDYEFNISLSVGLCRGGMWINFGRHGSQCSTKHGSGRIKEANREYEISGLHGALAAI